MTSLTSLGLCSDLFLFKLAFGFWETPLAEGSDEIVTLICEPYWQLMSPSKEISCMSWDTKDSLTIEHVAELSDILDS